MIRVYVAGPIGLPDEGRQGRLDAGIEAGRRLIKAGLAPFVPHMFPSCYKPEPLGYEGMMDVCFAFLEACHAVVRLPGASPGADREVAHALRLDRPLRVFYGVDEAIEGLTRRRTA